MSWRLLRWFVHHPRLVVAILWVAGLVAAVVLRGRHPSDDATADRVVDVVAYLALTGLALWWFGRRGRRRRPVDGPVFGAKGHRDG